MTRWSRTTLQGKPVEFLSPGAKPRFAVLHLHPVGEEMPSQNETFTRAYSEAGVAVVAPMGKRSWWSDRICPEFDAEMTAEGFLLDHVVPWMQQQWELPDRAIAVTGISMGGQGAVRLGLRYPERFPVVASIAGAFDYHEWYGNGTPIDEMYSSREHCRLDTAILQLQDHNWPPHIWFVCDPEDVTWYRGNDRLHEKLAAFGVNHFCDLESRLGGHTWAYFDAMAEPMVQFLRKSLETESRRLI